MSAIFGWFLKKNGMAVVGTIAILFGAYTYHRVEVNRAWNDGYKAAGQEAKSLAIQRQLELEKRLDELSKMPDDALRCELTGKLWDKAKNRCL